MSKYYEKSFFFDLSDKKDCNNDSYVHVASQTGQKKYKNVIPNVMIFYGCDKKCKILLCRDKAIKNGKYKKKIIMEFKETMENKIWNSKPTRQIRIWSKITKKD